MDLLGFKSKHRILNHGHDTDSKARRKTLDIVGCPKYNNTIATKFGICKFNGFMASLQAVEYVESPGIFTKYGKPIGLG